MTVQSCRLRIRPAPVRVERHLQVDGSDRLWVADITYVTTWAGLLYLAIVLDVFSRRGMVGGQSSSYRTVAQHAEHGLGALASPSRRPSLRLGLAVHFTGLRQSVPGDGVVNSTRTDGDCFGNAMAESFFAPSSANSSTCARFAPRPKREPLSSNFWKVGTTHAGAILLWATSAPTTSSAARRTRGPRRWPARLSLVFPSRTREPR